MYIKRICYPVTTLGPGARVGIWVTGCKQTCPGCMSPELRDCRAGRNYAIEAILDMISRISGPIDGFTISGGEPFLQLDDLSELVARLHDRFSTDIIVYSGYTLIELKAMYGPGISSVLENISVLIDGPYIDELNDGVGIRGSSNQVIHIFRDENKYRGLDSQPRKLQSFRYNDKILLIGIQ